MTYSIASTSLPVKQNPFDLRILLAAAIFLLISAAMSFAQISVTSASETFTVEDAPDQEIVCYGKTVIVKVRAKGVLAIGGDVIVEGRVSGDVFAIGGSVIQKDSAYIGGDVFAVGGVYKPENTSPLREEGRETITFTGYEEEIRDFSQNPMSMLSPHFSLTFLAWRLLTVFFWFVLSLGLTTLAPGAVSRGIARLNLSPLKIIGVGAAAFLITTIGVGASLNLFPNPIGAVVGMMAFILIMLAYFFGRVALNVSTGKLIQKHLLGGRNNSETLAIFLGVVAWTIVLSIPYVWPIALFVLFATGVGLVLTARSQRSWQAK